MVATGYAEILEMLDLAPHSEEDLSPDEVAEIERRAAEMGLKRSPEVHEEQAWTEEIVRRVQDLRAGRVQPIPAEEVFAHVRARLRSVRG